MVRNKWLVWNIHFAVFLPYHLQQPGHFERSEEFASFQRREQQIPRYARMTTGLGMATADSSLCSE